MFFKRHDGNGQAVNTQTHSEIAMNESKQSTSQADKFRRAASEAEADDREEAFDAVLRKITVLRKEDKKP